MDCDFLVSTEYGWILEPYPNLSKLWRQNNFLWVSVSLTDKICDSWIRNLRFNSSLHQLYRVELSLGGCGVHYHLQFFCTGHFKGQGIFVVGRIWHWLLKTMTVSIIYRNLRYKLDDKLCRLREIQFAYSYLKFEMVFKS